MISALHCQHATYCACSTLCCYSLHSTVKLKDNSLYLLPSRSLIFIDNLVSVLHKLKDKMTEGG